MQKEIDIKLVQDLVDKRVCCSKAEARRMVMGMTKERIQQRLDRVKVVRQQPCNDI